ncbi:cystatin-A-like [Betta splendens]|uniref:Cystatin-B n=1 Tax=Betta splendens TaxID=158456 RepID=A0A6P7M9I4_BETSP|nr:cystatin-A-like [Betta splendens]
MLLPENLQNSHQVETDSSPTEASLSVKMESFPGGYTDPRPATEEIQKYCNEVKQQVQAKTHKVFAEFKAVMYRSQVVEGIKYIIEVQVNECDYIHVQIFQALPCYGGEIFMYGVQEHHKKDDPLVPF